VNPGHVFPSSFAVAAIVIGAIWIIQGLGMANTGSFMDGNRFWAVVGAILVLVGLGTLIVRRLRRPHS
jgi:hypothetical protein